MWFASLVSLVLFIAFAATGDSQTGHQGSPSTGVTRPGALGSMNGKRSSNDIYKDMLLRNIYTHSSWDSYGTLKRAATFSWSDPNSNTSTCCTASWMDSTNSTNYPTSYIFCDTTSSSETWQWYFSSYISGSNFTLQLAHQFKDPAQFPPPYDKPTFFSTTAVKLECSHRHGLEGCYLPRDEKVVHAMINGISD